MNFWLLSKNILVCLQAYKFLLDIRLMHYIHVPDKVLLDFSSFKVKEQKLHLKSFLKIKMPEKFKTLQKTKIASK
jgi:hypothetical protein